MTLELYRAPTPLKLALLWATLMFLYIYNDYFSLYLPGEVEGMIAGRIGPLGAATEGVLVAVSLMLAIPALMIALSVLAPAPVSRWLNVGFGAAYTVIQALTLTDDALFYRIVVVLEIVVTATIITLALRWPRTVSAP